MALYIIMFLQIRSHVKESMIYQQEPVINVSHVYTRSLLNIILRPIVIKPKCI